MNEIKYKFRITFLSDSSNFKKLGWWLLVTIVFVLLSWVIACIRVKGNYPLTEILSMFLDPGNFKADIEVSFWNNLFRFIVTIIGLLLLSAILISLLTNTLENISDSYKNGTSRFKHNGHVLILGAGHQLFGILNEINKKNCPQHGKEIVIVSDCNIEELRKDTFEKFDSKEDKAFLKKITFYHGSRDNSSILSYVSVLKSEFIYIIGEDDEEGHDLLSVKCCDNIIEIFSKEGKPEESSNEVNCYLVLNDRTSVDIYKYMPSEDAGRLNIDVIYENEHICESVIAYEHRQEGTAVHNQETDVPSQKEDVHYPVIDYCGTEEDTTKDEDDRNRWKQIKGIKQDSTKHVHFVIAGMTQMARAMAITAANICHFPNFKDGKNRTVITFVCKDIKGEMNKFISRYDNMFILTHYTYITFNEQGQKVEIKHTPGIEYGDFLDIEWEFIEGELTDPNLRQLMVEWSADESQSLSLAICMDSQMENASTAISLPDEIYSKEKKIPIFVYQRFTEKLICKARKSGQYGNMYAFGMDNEPKKDPLYENNEGKRINYIYALLHSTDSKAYDGVYHQDDSARKWKTQKTYNKLSSICSAESIFMKKRSFKINNSEACTLSEESFTAFRETEHRRWMSSVLILGQKPMTIKDRIALNERVEQKRRELIEDSDIKKQYEKEFKAKFIHYDLTPADEMMSLEKENNTDGSIVKNLDFIITGDSEKYKL